MSKRKLVALALFIIMGLFMFAFAGSPDGEELEPVDGTTLDVTFIDGFDNSTISTQKVVMGGAAEVPEVPYHRDYVFAGWYDRSDETRQVITFTNIRNNLAVLARYSDDLNNNGISDEEEELLTVTFMDTIDNVVLKTQQVLPGLGATAPLARFHEGFVFNGWSREFINVTENITVDTIYVNAVQPIVTYTVTYNKGLASGSLPSDTKQYLLSESATVLDNVGGLTLETAKFIGWTTDANLANTILNNKADFSNIYYPEDTIQIIGNITLYAVFQLNEYTVRFLDWDATVLKIEIVEHGSSVIAPEDPFKVGYRFSGWDHADFVITNNLTINAVYGEDYEQTRAIDYTIKYVSGEIVLATITESKLVWAGAASYIANVVEADVELKTFTGYVRKTDSPVLPATITYEEENVILVEYDVNNYILTYIINGNSTNDTYDYDSLIELPNKSEIDELLGGIGKFLNWSVSSTCVTTVPTNMPACDVNLTANIDFAPTIVPSGKSTTIDVSDYVNIDSYLYVTISDDRDPSITGVSLVTTNSVKEDNMVYNEGILESGTILIEYVVTDSAGNVTTYDLTINIITSDIESQKLVAVLNRDTYSQYSSLNKTSDIDVYLITVYKSGKTTREVVSPNDFTTDFNSDVITPDSEPNELYVTATIDGTVWVSIDPQYYWVIAGSTAGGGFIVVVGEENPFKIEYYVGSGNAKDVFMFYTGVGELSISDINAIDGILKKLGNNPKESDVKTALVSYSSYVEMVSLNGTCTSGASTDKCYAVNSYNFSKGNGNYYIFGVNSNETRPSYRKFLWIDSNE